MSAASATSARPSVSKTPTAFARRRFPLAPLVFAVFLYGLNNLALWSAWLDPPKNYTPTFMMQANDIGDYMTWARASETRMFLPNYHAPWHTEPGLIYPLMFVLARLCRLTGIGLVAGYHGLLLCLYLGASYSLYWCYRLFTDDRKQAVAAFFAILCSVPVPALAVLPVSALTAVSPAVAPALGRWANLPGLGDFVFWSSDGFFHGIEGAAGAAFGTGASLLVLAIVAAYLKKDQKRYLICAAVAIFVAGVFHPFEVFVMVGASAAAFFWLRRLQWRRALWESALLGASGALGISHYVVMGFRYPWLRDSIDLARWHPGFPARLMIMLGLPTVTAVALLVWRPKMASKTDVLLQSWVMTTLVFIYVPWIPWTQHLLDGFHYAVGLLLVRQLSQSVFIQRLFKRKPRLVMAGVSACCILSISPYVAFHRQAFLDGRSAHPARLFSAVAPDDELAVIAWLRRNAREDELVLGPTTSASMLATVPMHSFASDYRYGITFPEQLRLANDFYDGKLDMKAAQEMLQDYGVRYLVVPDGSSAAGYVKSEPVRVRLGSMSIYEFPGNSMKPYVSPLRGSR